VVNLTSKVVKSGQFNPRKWSKVSRNWSKVANLTSKVVKSGQFNLSNNVIDQN